MSPAAGAGQPDVLRVSDAERDAAIVLLSRHTGEGRLTLSEFDDRVDAALHARTVRDLNAVVDDLPASQPDTAVRARRYVWAHVAVLCVVIAGAVAVNPTVWLLTLPVLACFARRITAVSAT